MQLAFGFGTIDAERIEFRDLVQETFLRRNRNHHASVRQQDRLTLRDWNLQLRQSILLADGRMVVSVSPQEGFLHQVSELDTLGVDRPETKCKLH